MIDELLEDPYLVNASTYADDIKSHPKYKSLSPWHFLNLPLDESYDSGQKVIKEVCLLP